MKVFQVVAGDAQQPGDAAAGHHGGSNAEAVAVVDFAAGEVGTGGFQLVAGGEHRHYGTADDLDPVQAEGRQDANLGGADDGSGFQY